MARIPLITSRDELGIEAQGVFDQIMESRGEVSRPFEVLLHAPAAARKVAELGHVVRSESGLSRVDRELVTVATGRAHGCAFVWESHRDAARAAGIDPDRIAEAGDDGRGLSDRQRTLVSFVNELCSAGSISQETFGATVEIVGTAGVVELVVTVGYYTMLSYAMRALEAC
jgi:4-carboxymuconolactone decarboxylase